MAKAETYDWGKFSGWAEFVADNTWSLPNSVIASLFNTGYVIAGKEVDATLSKGTGQLVYTKGFSSDYATTFGNVTVGREPHVHEAFHATQARIFGPLFYPSVLANYVVATILPYWLLYHDTRYPGKPIDSFGAYFTRGVYPHVWAEDWAYKFDPHSSPL